MENVIIDGVSRTKKEAIRLGLLKAKKKVEPKPEPKEEKKEEKDLGNKDNKKE